MRGITVSAEVASAAGKISEDAYGHVGDRNFGAAWVLDGATGLAGRDYIPGEYSDAAWYAQELSKALTRHSLVALSPERIFTIVIRQIAKLWHAATGTAEVPRYALPSAAGIWVRWKNNVLEAVSLGDCRAWHVGADGSLTQLGLMNEDPNDDWVAAQVAQHQAVGILPENMREKVMDSLRAARGRMNQPDGYWIFGIHEEAARHLPLRRMEITSGHIVLCSDGVFRWVDIYRQGGVADFTHACVKDMSGMLASLREIENGDADCKIFPRLKSQDDATGIVLRVELE